METKNFVCPICDKDLHHEIPLFNNEANLKAFVCSKCQHIELFASSPTVENNKKVEILRVERSSLEAEIRALKERCYEAFEEQANIEKRIHKIDSTLASEDISDEFRQKLKKERVMLEGIVSRAVAIDDLKKDICVAELRLAKITETLETLKS